IPVFRRETDLPEFRRGLVKFNSHLSFAAMHRCSHVNDAALLGILGPLVNQRAVRVHHQCFRFLFECISFGIFSANNHRYGKHYAQAAATPFVERQFLGAWWIRHPSTLALPVSHCKCDSATHCESVNSKKNQKARRQDWREAWRRRLCCHSTRHGADWPEQICSISPQTIWPMVICAS